MGLANCLFCSTQPEDLADLFTPKIYGGGLQFGNAGQPAYDGSWFASYEDVIVVTVNYRTNGTLPSTLFTLLEDPRLSFIVFGFPSSPELPITGHNLGFLDQRMGLDWTQRNIAAFGGSPDKVTIVRIRGRRSRYTQALTCL